MGFVFYDTETTGTDTSFDQILQFAAIHTDGQLNELERFEIRCQLLPYVVPAPGAMRVTGVRPEQLFDPSLPTHYEMIRRIREKLVAWSPALFVGYNSIDFDEHLFRQSLYKTLHPPYLTNTNGNARSDALRMVQAASLFSPDALASAFGDDGKTSYKLDRTAPANGFNHEHAHDALADVEATIFICRRLMDKAPAVWSAFMRFSQKAAVSDYVSSELYFCLSAFYFCEPYSWLVTSVGSNPENRSELYVFDLSVNPEELIGLSKEELACRLAIAPKPIRKIKSNASPIIMPAEDAPPIAAAAHLGTDEVARRADFLQSEEAFRQRMIEAVLSLKLEPEESPHVENQLYGGFFPQADQQRLDAFHLAPWEDRPSIVDAFEDRRLKTIGRRLIHTERPGLLSPTVRAEYDKAIAKRLLGTGGEVPWLTLPQAITEIDELIQSAETDDAEHLREHRNHLTERHIRATKAIG